MYAPPYPLSLLIHLFLDKLRPIIWLALHIRLPIAILTQPLVAVLRTFSTHVIWPFNSTISRWAESSPQILSSDNIPQHTCTNHNRECGYLDQFIFILLPDIPSWLGSTSRHRWYALQEMNDRRFHIKYLVRIKYSASNAKFPTNINLQYEKYVCLLFQLPIQNYYRFLGGIPSASTPQTKLQPILILLPYNVLLWLVYITALQRLAAIQKYSPL